MDRKDFIKTIIWFTMKYVDFIFLYIALHSMINGLFKIGYDLYHDSIGDYNNLLAAFVLLSISVVYFLIRFILHIRK